MDVGDFTITGIGTSPNGSLTNKIDTSSFNWNGFLDVNGTSHILGDLSTNSSIQFDFDSPITAFGADFNKFGDGGRLNQFVIGSDTINVTGEPDFFGFVSDMSFSQFSLQYASSNSSFNEVFGADNVVYTSALEPASTPEPASILGLLAFGAMGAGSMLNRK